MYARHGVLLALLLLLAAVAAAAVISAPGASAEEVAWGDDEVARAGDASVTWDDLCRTAVDAVALDLLDARSRAHAVLGSLLGTHIVKRIALREGVEIGDEAVEALLEEHGAALREHGLPRRLQVEMAVRHLREKALAEAGVDVEAERKAMRIALALPTAEEGEPSDLPEGVLATVEGDPIPLLAFGDRLLASAAPRTLQEWIERALKIALATAYGTPLDEAAMRAELDHLARIAPLESRFDPEEVWDRFAVRGGAVRRERPTPRQLLESPYARSLFGMVRRFRDEATEAEVRQAWARQRDSVYGPHVLAMDLEIAFRSAGDVFTPGVTRSRREALELAHRLRRRLADGASFETVAEEAGGEGIAVRRLRLYATNRSRLLHDLALALEDGEVSRPFETLAEVHVLQRERLVPAPPFEQIEPLVRERLARDRARRTLEDGIADPVTTKRRWPLPQLR